MQFARSLICFCLLATTALAQTVRWQNAGTGDPADLQLVYENCQPDGDPQIPAISDARLGFSGRSEQTSIINFSVTRTVVLSYRLQISQAASVTIPAFQVKTNKGELTVPAYSTNTIEPGPEADIKATLQTGQKTVWVGEVFPITYSFDVAKRSLSNFGQVDWDSTPLIVEDWGKYQAAETNRNGESRVIVAFRNRGYAKAPGTLHLNPAGQLVNLATGTTGFRLFQQQRIEQVAIHSDKPELTVRALPTPAPASFQGAVGQFKLTSKVVPEETAVGEPITWTLELSGTGNWPEIAGLPPREVSQDFKVISPQAKKTPEEGKLFDATLSEDVVLVPTKPGTYHLGAVEFSYFDPATGAYQTLKTPAKTITIGAAPESNEKRSAAPLTPSANNEPAAPAAKAPAAAVDPQGIPRDPIPGSAHARAPFASASTLTLAALIPLAGVLLAWLLLAARRTRQTDPRKPRRAAHQRLGRTLAELATASESERDALLIAWQHDTAQLWSLDHAAPAASAFDDTEWATLWTEAEQALYSSKNTLPSDWLPRAEAALVARKVPGTAWLRAFLPRNLFPFFVIALGILLAAPSLQAEDAAESYRAGKFSAAEKSWQQAVDATPTDWVARHNLSLALAQQNRWPEAAAQATAAFVQNPRTDATRWNLALAYQKAGYTPTAIGPLLESHPRSDLARLASPAEWECVLIISSIAIALALIVLLLLAYQVAPRWSKWPALILLLIGALLVGGALTGRATYGIAGNPQVALVWHSSTLYSIPTEADTTQQTTTLPAGAMGTMDKTFLGWTRLTFPNGQTGWVRQSELVTLWK